MPDSHKIDEKIVVATTVTASKESGAFPNRPKPILTKSTENKQGANNTKHAAIPNGKDHEAEADEPSEVTAISAVFIVVLVLVVFAVV